jgi:type I restriction enzyme M protein
LEECSRWSHLIKRAKQNDLALLIDTALHTIEKNKKAHTRLIGDELHTYRDRSDGIIFIDLRQMGEPFEKEYTQFSEADIQKVVNTYHQWQTREIENIPEFLYSASIEEVTKKDFSLVPSKYIEFVNRDENIDFDEKMKALQAEFGELLKAEEQSKQELLTVFRELGYEI